MLFRNSFRLLTENFKNVYKILLYQILVAIVALALYSVLILPEFTQIWNNAVTVELRAALGKFFDAFFSANGQELTLIKEQIFSVGGLLQRFGELLVSKLTPIIFTALGCVLVHLLKRFAETLCFFAVGSALSDKMSTYAETPLFGSYVANLGKASVYALVYVPVVFAFDLLTIVAVIFLMSTLDLFPALFLSVTLVVVCQAFKLTFTGLWMPAMTADKKRLRDAFKYENKTEKKQRRKIFANYIVTVYAVIILNLAAALFTFGSALLITIPASFMLFICQQYVNYYTIKGKKYFITYETIATNPDYGDKEHFFDYIDETATVKFSEEETKENQE